MFTNETNTSWRRAPLRHGQHQHPACGGDDDSCVTATTESTTSFPINRGSVLRIKSIPVKRTRILQKIPFLFLSFSFEFLLFVFNGMQKVIPPDSIDPCFKGVINLRERKKRGSAHEQVSYIPSVFPHFPIGDSNGRKRQKFSFNSPFYSFPLNF
jgi:hypothetical protein